MWHMSINVMEERTRYSNTHLDVRAMAQYRIQNGIDGRVDIFYQKALPFSYRRLQD